MQKGLGPEMLRPESRERIYNPPPEQNRLMAPRNYGAYLFERGKRVAARKQALFQENVRFLFILLVLKFEP